MSKPPVVRPDPDPRGPDFDNPTPTQEHIDAAKLAIAEPLGVAPIVDVPASPANYTPTRLGYKVQGVIIHTMVGTLGATDGTFANPARQASAHYGVACDGSVIHRYVAESNIAWHCGRYYTDATDPLANVNTIGIEHCDNGDAFAPRSDAEYQCSGDLVRDICKRYGIPIDRVHIRRHKEVSQSPTGCPDTLDIDRIVAIAAGQPAPIPAVGEDEMVYTGPIHPFSGAFPVFDAGAASFPDPVAVAAVGKPIAQSTTVTVDAYCYSSSPVQSSDLGNGQPGPDNLYFRSGGRWVPDAHLDTSGNASAPKPAIPAGEVLTLYGGGVTLALVDVEVQKLIAGLSAGLTRDQVDAEIQRIVAGLPSGLSKDQVDAEILTALGNLPKPVGALHHHGVLGIIATGPAVAD